MVVVDPTEMVVALDPQEMIKDGWLLTVQTPRGVSPVEFGPLCMACARKHVSPEKLAQVLAMIQKVGEKETL